MDFLVNNLVIDLIRTVHIFLLIEKSVCCIPLKYQNHPDTAILEMISSIAIHAKYLFSAKFEHEIISFL